MYISIGPSPTIDIICGLPSDVYQLGRLRRLILFLTTLRCISIGPSPMIDNFSLDYPPIINILDNPPNHFSLDSSLALTPIVLGCPSAYEMHDANSIQFYNTCKYINMHIFT